MKKAKYGKAVIKNLSNLGIFIHIITLSIAIFYFIFPAHSFLYEILGYTLISSWVINGILIYTLDISLNKSVQIGKHLNKISYYYLVLFIASIILMVFGVILSTYMISGILLMLGNIMIITGFLITIIYGLHFCIVAYTNVSTRGAWKVNKPKMLKYLKHFLRILCYMTLFVGIIFTLFLLIPIRSSLSFIISYFLSQITGFLMFLYLPTTLLLLKLTQKKRFKNWNRVSILVVGLSITIINALPFMSVPTSIQTAENEFAMAYGAEWESQIPQSAENYFLPTQFNLYNYYLGFPHRDCNFETDILYYDDDGIKLYFDVFYPKGNVAALPGNGSIIIKIHGGGWQHGDKSLGNALVLSKYLASQGYIVFDIQYGLFDSGYASYIPTPDYVLGNFTLHDMVYQIGNFTKLLETTYASTYDANLNSVFIMGGSAGGQLTGVVGLGYNDPYFAGNFSNALKIKGIVPMYPPDFAPSYLLPGDELSNPLAFEKFTPSNLADASDPPAIIYQGLRDDLVSLDNPIRIKNSLNNEGVDCLLLTFPFAAHASDFIIGNSFSQVWVYYLERFFYLEQ